MSARWHKSYYFTTPTVGACKRKFAVVERQLEIRLSVYFQFYLFIFSYICYFLLGIHFYFRFFTFCSQLHPYVQ